MMVGYDPKTYQEASLDQILKKTMQEEFNSLQGNGDLGTGSLAFQEETSTM